MNPIQLLDWNEILETIQNFSSSESGKQSVRNHSHFETPEGALQYQNNVFEAIKMLYFSSRPTMESLDLFDHWWNRLVKKGTLQILELRDIRTFCVEAMNLKEAILKTFSASTPVSANVFTPVSANVSTPVSATVSANASATASFSTFFPTTDTLGPEMLGWRGRLKINLMDAERPYHAIDQVLTPSGEIRSDASEKLYQLTREKESMARQIQNQLDRLVKAHQMQSYLQDKYVTTREGRWVLPIKSGMQHSVPGILHGSSQTKQTVFIEPEELIPLNNRLRQVEVEMEEEIERLLYELSLFLGSLSEPFLITKKLMLESDVLLAFAQWCLKLDAKPFSFVPDEIFLHEIKHPVLRWTELNVSHKKAIGNTIHLNGKKSILLLSGPNAGGKTVLLKSIGLAAHMARCGLPLCAAEGSRLPFFKHIHIGIGDFQSVDEELSTFAAHLQVLKNGLGLNGLDQLILMDEICGSTDPEEGAALARAFIEQYSRNQVFAIITSHLGPLKSGWTDQDHILNGSLEYDMKNGRPTYQFLPGIPGDSLALQTAKRVGIPEIVLDRAMEWISPTMRARLAGLEEISQMKSDIHMLQNELKKEKQRAMQEQNRYNQLREQLEKEKGAILDKIQKTTEKKIEELISLTGAEKALNRHRSLQEIKRDLPQVIKASSGGPSSFSGESGFSVPACQTAEDFCKVFPPGSRVFIPHLNQNGIVQSEPNTRGEVMVLSGSSVRLNLPWTQLKPPMTTFSGSWGWHGGGGSGEGGSGGRGTSTGSGKFIRSTADPSVTSSLSSERVLDYRGLRVEEALEQLEMALDQASERGESRIKIIHGHGTEALKKAIRTALSRSLYVKKWKSGVEEQGGDGITWVEIET